LLLALAADPGTPKTVREASVIIVLPGCRNLIYVKPGSGRRMLQAAKLSK
jgi:hypothetical protein